ncbi:MAG: phosphate acyltransferase [Ruminococcus sp.]|nr:phosphate acyltransferase [Ruminococcus sp.]
MIKIAVDLQGADRPQTELAEGAFRAVRDNEDLFLYLCGGRQELETCMKEQGFTSERIEFVDASQVITNSDDPAEAFKEKKDSSLIRGMQLCKDDPEIGGFVTCGPTGAIFVSALMLLGRIARVSPMLLVELSRPDGTPFCVVDCGANVDCRAEKLVDFARMGIAYMKAAGVSEPKVGLLSNGAEDGKGSAVVKSANKLLREQIPQFTGNVEGSGVFTGSADVIVCDGFSGNILLKTTEGAAKAAIAELRAMGVSGEAVDKLYAKYDHNIQGGAVLLGTKLPIIKGHGAAASQTVYNIIKAAYKLAVNRINEKIEREFTGA